MTLSLIIPIYNAERYLRRCLDSVLAQTYTDYECILVDDGSLDGSLFICQEYANSHSQFIVFHKTNGGEADARNYGIRQAQGKYICWLDADDELLPDYLKTLIDGSKSLSDTDLVVMGITRVMGNYLHEISPIVSGTLCFSLPRDANQMFEMTNIRDFGVSPSKLFRRDIIVQNQLLYSPSIRVAVDLDFLLRYLVYCKKIVFSAHSSYLYHQLPDTLSRANYTFEQEMSGLTQLSSSWRQLSLAVGNSSSLVHQQSISLADYTHRVVIASYGKGLSSVQRIQNHHLIPRTFIDNYGSWFRPTMFLRLVSYLFFNNHYRLADWLLNLRIG